MAKAPGDLAWGLSFKLHTCGSAAAFRISMSSSYPIGLDLTSFPDSRASGRRNERVMPEQK